MKDIGSDTVLPIWVGIYEANAIALEIEKVTTPAPHDPRSDQERSGRTRYAGHKVVVTELREDTFYAVIWMERQGSVISIDSRPSDALALALRVDCPIFVEDDVLKNSKLATNASDRVTSEELRKWLEGLNDEIWAATRCNLSRVAWSQHSAEGLDLKWLLMSDPAEQLQRIYLAGFDLQTFDRFPKCVGVVRDGCVALLVPSIDGLQMLGTPGWRLGEAIGVLVEMGRPPGFPGKAGNP